MTQNDHATNPGTLDLSPHTEAPVRQRRTGGTRWLAMGALVLIVAAVGFVLVRGLSDATVFFYNVDDAVAKRSEIGTARVRLQGNVVEGSVERRDGGVRFQLRYHDAEVTVDHTGEPPELFGPKIPVVVEGSFVGDTTQFQSDRILIRHDNNYDAANKDRITQASIDAQRPNSPATP